jgi:cytochrome c oxidase cbb3-type subunit 4
MSEAWGHLVGVLTVLIMLSFLAIWVWAWLPHHKLDFESLARLPLRDDTSDDAGESRTDADASP